MKIRKKSEIQWNSKIIFKSMSFKIGPNLKKQSTNFTKKTEMNEANLEMQTSKQHIYCEIAHQGIK